MSVYPGNAPRTIAKRAKTAARGYGSEHQRLRRMWAPKVRTGQVRCARCKIPIGAIEPWHLGHDDHDRSKYTGPEHVDCNSGAPHRRLSSRAW